MQKLFNYNFNFNLYKALIARGYGYKLSKLPLLT